MSDDDAAPRLCGRGVLEQGGDVIHFSDANNRTDVPLRFLVTMTFTPGQPMLVRVGAAELEERRVRRVR